LLVTKEKGKNGREKKEKWFDGGVEGGGGWWREGLKCRMVVTFWDFCGVLGEWMGDIVRSCTRVLAYARIGWVGRGL